MITVGSWQVKTQILSFPSVSPFLSSLFSSLSMLPHSIPCHLEHLAVFLHIFHHAFREEFPNAKGGAETHRKQIHNTVEILQGRFPIITTLVTHHSIKKGPPLHHRNGMESFASMLLALGLRCCRKQAQSPQAKGEHRAASFPLNSVTRSRHHPEDNQGHRRQNDYVDTL